jgi:hypothetical protein
VLAGAPAGGYNEKQPVGNSSPDVQRRIIMAGTWRNNDKKLLREANTLICQSESKELPTNAD